MTGADGTGGATLGADVDSDRDAGGVRRIGGPTTCAAAPDATPDSARVNANARRTEPGRDGSAREPLIRQDLLHRLRRSRHVPGRQEDHAAAENQQQQNDKDGDEPAHGTKGDVVAGIGQGERPYHTCDRAA
jgi:hypothetical protein